MTQSITGIGRPIDFAYPTNRAIVLFTVLSGGVSGLLRYIQVSHLTDSLKWGGSTGIAVFLSWAVAREIDPDYELSAFVAAIIGIFLHWSLGPPALLIALSFLLLSRILNRSTGLPIRWGDSLVCLGLSLWIMIFDHWLFGVLAATVFLLDGGLKSGTRRHIGFGVVCMITVSALLIFQSRGQFRMIDLSAIILWLIPLNLLFLWVIIESRYPLTVADNTTDRISGSRLQSLQLIMLLSLNFAGIFGGLDWIGRLGPLSASIAGVSLYRVLGKFLPT